MVYSSVFSSLVSDDDLDSITDTIIMKTLVSSVLGRPLVVAKVSRLCYFLPALPLLILTVYSHYENIAAILPLQAKTKSQSFLYPTNTVHFCVYE